MIFVLVLLTVAPATLATRDSAAANPVRKVVNLLQNMAKKVEAEGEKEDELYKKFSCYCKTGIGNLQGSISSGTTKSPQLASDIKAAEEQQVQTKQSLKDAQKERSEAKAAIADATAIREKDAAAFAAEKKELDSYISAITSAVAALEKGMAGFLQTGATSLLRKAAEASSLQDDQKEGLLSFLSGKQSAEYAPSSGEITGILKQMGDEMTKSLNKATTTEKDAISDYNGLVAAKNKEIDTLTDSIETRTAKVGELGVSIVQMKDDLSDTEERLVEDQKLLAELQKGCDGKDKEYDERVKTRGQELAAITETIKILNDDDALELFKKTLPSPSLVQVATSAADMRSRALSALNTAGHTDQVRLDFLALALKGKKVGFDKIIVLIDEMVAALKKEQVSDNDKKEYCSAQFDTSEDKKKSLERAVSDLATSIRSAEEGIAQYTEEIAATENSIKALDKMVSEASEQRMEESAEYKELVKSDTAAAELLAFAKNRLNKFYNPKLYNPPAKQELSSQSAIERDMSLVQISEHVQVEPPPETWDAYAKKSEESTGVISMIDLLIKDLDKELTEAKVQEDNAQAEYDRTVADAKEERVSMSKSLTDKSAAKADLQSDLETSQAQKKETEMSLMATDKFISQLHGECDWLLQYFEVREQARAGEIDALGKAKDVLKGADYSLLQTSLRGSAQ
jgi:chromosome segregation ATPase